MNFVDIYGRPLNVDALPRSTAPAPKAPAVKRTNDSERATEHHGFEVVGVRAADLEQARSKHALKTEAAAAAGKPMLALFSANDWLSKARPRRAIPRAFVIQSAAEQAAGMVCAGGGWFRVQVVEILKG